MPVLILLKHVVLKGISKYILKWKTPSVVALAINQENLSLLLQLYDQFKLLASLSDNLCGYVSQYIKPKAGKERPAGWNNENWLKINKTFYSFAQKAPVCELM